MVHYGRDLWYFFVAEVQKPNHTADIYAKYQFTNKLLNYDLSLGRDVLHELGIIFSFKIKLLLAKKTMNPPNCNAKEFFVIKESLPVRIVSKRIKQLLDVKYKKINLKTTVVKHKDSLFELFQKYEKIFEVTLRKYLGSDFAIPRIEGRCKALSYKSIYYSKN